MQGFYKPSFIVLANYELYVYQDKDSKTHKSMYLLAQDMGILVFTNPPIKVEGGKKYYPIEIDLAIDGAGVARQAIVLFFDSQDMVDKWYELLQKATGSYPPWHYYKFAKTNDQGERTDFPLKKLFANK